MTQNAVRVLSLIPPMTQLNTPYPSTAYLTGFLRSRGIEAAQADIALALVLRLFSPAGLDELRERAKALPEAERSGSLHAFLDQFETYRSTIGPTIRFLQGPTPRWPTASPRAACCPRDRALRHWTTMSTTAAVTRWAGPSITDCP